MATNKNSQHLFMNYELNKDGYDGSHLLVLAASRLLNPNARELRAQITLIDDEGDYQHTTLLLDREKCAASMGELTLTADHPKIQTMKNRTMHPGITYYTNIPDILSITSGGYEVVDIEDDEEDT